jgi:hypothetical protein
MHTLTIAIEQRVLSKSLLNRRCPAYALWPRWSPLAQKGQEHFVALANRLWRKQAEVSNSMAVTIRNLLGKAGDELMRGAGGGDFPAQLLIFGQITNLLVVVAGEEPVLGQRRPA